MSVAIREQLAELADTALHVLEVAPGGKYSLVVTAGQNTVLVENAFVEAGRKRGLVVRLSQESGHHSDSVVRVLVISQEVHYESLTPSGFLRLIDISLEARMEDQVSGEMRVSGILHSTRVDTVSQRSDDPPEERTSFLERMVEPIVVLAGSILIVYLLFTVRSP